MSNRTTESWEALLEGTTEGPWKFEEHISHGYPAGPEWGSVLEELEHAVQDEKGEHLFGAYNNYKMIEHPGNLPLAAAAPEAVAEVVRLRNELETQLSYTNRNLEHEGVEKHEDLDPFGWSMQEYGELSEQINQRDFLIRILKGES